MINLIKIIIYVIYLVSFLVLLLFIACVPFVYLTNYVLDILMDIYYQIKQLIIKYECKKKMHFLLGPVCEFMKRNHSVSLIKEYLKRFT